MVPVDHWRDNGDGTAWVLVSSDPRSTPAGWVCPSCGGGCDADDLHFVECDHLSGHAFAVEVGWQTEVDAYEWEAYLAHVVPGMVLPIKHPTEPRIPPNVVLGSDGLAVVHRADVRYGGTEWATLPAAAKPGMWVVLLQLHEVDR
jgi:hypothetical protein